MNYDNTEEARALRLIRLAGDLIDEHLCIEIGGNPNRKAHNDTLYEVVESLCSLAVNHLRNRIPTKKCS